MNKYAIILAGGRGTRMCSELPKCGYPFLEKPMICWIVEALKKANINDIVVVIGYNGNYIKQILGNEVTYVYQHEQLGTGHAALCCEEYFKDKKGLSLVFPGDMPLVDEEIINGLVNKHSNCQNALTVVTTIVDDAKAYGRIYRENNSIKKIVEAKDATSEQLQIKEINSGLYCCDVELMFNALHQINNNNKSNEYYFTDIIEKISKSERVDSYIVSKEESYKLTGINDQDTLHKTEQIYLMHHKKEA